MSETVLFSKAKIEERVTELAAKIHDDYKGKKCILLAVLTGSYIFVSDLSRALWEVGYKDFEVDFIGVSSYGARKQSSNNPQLTKDTKLDIQNQHVIIVEDVIESGFTLEFLHNLLWQRNPASLKTVVLLSKSSKKQTPFSPEYIGFEVDGNIWVEGYGLDSGGLGRGSPDIVVQNNE